MPISFTESVVEQVALASLENLSYGGVDGPDVAPEELEAG